MVAGALFLLSVALGTIHFAEPMSDAVPGLSLGLVAAAAAVLLTFVTCPVYLQVLRLRDERNLDTSGLSLSVTAMAVALVAFVAVAALLAPTFLGLV